MTSLQFYSMPADQVLAGHNVFLSASIPDAERWAGYFDAREIVDAVVAASRAVLTAGGTLVTAAHPTIAPLLLYIAAEFPRAEGEPAKVITYQSELFQDVMPEATVRFADLGIGERRITPAVPGEEPVPARWNGSLLIMRRRMFDESRPVAAIFAGGMAGIREEYDLLASQSPPPFAYCVGRPGGEAARLGPGNGSSLGTLLATGGVYPTIFRAVVSDIAVRLRMQDR